MQSAERDAAHRRRALPTGPVPLEWRLQLLRFPDAAELQAVGSSVCRTVSLACVANASGLRCPFTDSRLYSAMSLLSAVPAI